MTASPVASVIVPTYNRSAVFEQCLRALLAQTPATPPYEIIVVDDASRDSTPDVARALANSSDIVRYLRHETNQGLSAARNAGIRVARGEFVIFIDDDIVVEPDYIAAHLRVHAAVPDVRLAVIGNLLYPETTVAASNCAKYLQSRYIGYRWRSGDKDLDRQNVNPRYLGGGISSVRRADLLAIGMFDESIRFYGCEDHIYAYLLYKTGVRIVFAPDAHAIHLDAVSLDRFRAKMYQAGRDGLAVLREKCPEFLEGTALPAVLPIDWRHDDWRRLLGKLTVRTVLNPLAIWSLERWASATDHIGRLYSATVYRALNAGWILRAQRLRRDGRSFVRYGE